MSPSVTCYPTPNKSKAERLCKAFALGAGGVLERGLQLRDGPAAFYGVVKDTLPLWRQCGAEKRDWYYLDNAYFDSGRGTFFRVTRNALQASGAETPDWKRYAQQGPLIEPWQKRGRHIVVCPQSDWFLRAVCGIPGGVDGWLQSVLQQLNRHTDRPVVVRHIGNNKIAAAAGLFDDLRGAWALVTHMSAAANMALAAGVPVFTTGTCAATRMGLAELERIEQPRRPDGRAAWAAALAGRQWTEDELRDGTAWKALHAG